MYIVYKIIRDDGQVYIGTTYKSGLSKRMTAHSKTDRFCGHTFSYEIIEEGSDYDYIMTRESYHINVCDSYHNGLNESVDGKGNHLCPEFTTKCFRFSEESKEKMSVSAKKRVKRYGVPFKGGSHTDEQKQKWSVERKGKLPPNTRLTEERVKELVDMFADKPSIEGVGEVMKNGRRMSYIRAFSITYCDDFSVTPQQIERIIKGKVWKNVERKYKI